MLLGLLGGLFVSRNVSRAMAGLNAVVAAVQGGDLRARAHVRGAKDEFDELATGLNDMLDRLERSMAGIRHAGDAIAHDLRSPLTRLRARMEVALLDVEAGKGDPKAALVQALDDSEGVLRTFNAVLAIARLQAAEQAQQHHQRARAQQRPIDLDHERLRLADVGADEQALAGGQADLFAPRGLARLGAGGGIGLGDAELGPVHVLGAVGHG